MCVSGGQQPLGFCTAGILWRPAQSCSRCTVGTQNSLHERRLCLAQKPRSPLQGTHCCPCEKKLFSDTVLPKERGERLATVVCLTFYSLLVTICTTQWSLYVPPVLHSTVLRSTHTAVFMCFVWTWEQTAIIYLYNINWLVFITERECLMRGTHWIIKRILGVTWFLRVVPWFRRLIAGLSPQILGFGPRSVYESFVVDTKALGQISLPVLLPFSAGIIQPKFHTLLHFHVALTRRTKNVKKQQCCLGYRGLLNSKSSDYWTVSSWTTGQ
jgi:hypothetical protein